MSSKEKIRSQGGGHSELNPGGTGLGFHEIEEDLQERIRREEGTSKSKASKAVGG